MMSAKNSSRSAAVGMAASESVCFVAALCLVLLLASQLIQETTADETVNHNQIHNGEKV